MYSEAEFIISSIPFYQLGGFEQNFLLVISKQKKCQVHRYIMSIYGGTVIGYRFHHVQTDIGLLKHNDLSSRMTSTALSYTDRYSSSVLRCHVRNHTYRPSCIELKSYSIHSNTQSYVWDFIMKVEENRSTHFDKPLPSHINSMLHFSNIQQSLVFFKFGGSRNSSSECAYPHLSPFLHDQPASNVGHIFVLWNAVTFTRQRMKI